MQIRECCLRHEMTFQEEEKQGDPDLRGAVREIDSLAQSVVGDVRIGLMTPQNIPKVPSWPQKIPDPQHTRICVLSR